MFALGFVVALAAMRADAHGPQIQITVDTANNNRLVTRQLLQNEPYSSAVGLTTPVSLYVLPVLPVSFVGQPVSRVKTSSTETFGPGFTYGYDQTLGGSRLITSNLNLHVGSLEIWNGSSFAPTGSGKEQLGLLQSSSNVNADSVKTTSAGGDLPISISTTYTADAHSSVRYQLLGDGVDPYVASRDGVYLATLQVSGTQTSPNLSPSEPFYFLLSKNVGVDTVAAVAASFAASRGINSANVQFAGVPEPNTLAITAGGLMLGAVARRRGGKSR
jgi:hypothetical protein